MHEARKMSIYGHKIQWHHGPDIVHKLEGKFMRKVDENGEKKWKSWVMNGTSQELKFVGKKFFFPVGKAYGLKAAEVLTGLWWVNARED